MSTLINQFTLPDNTRYPNALANYAANNNNAMFCTVEGLLAFYVSTNAASSQIRRVSLYNPAHAGAMTGANVVAEWQTAVIWNGVGYSHSHKAMIGIPTGYGTGQGSVKKLDLKTGAESVIGTIDLSKVGNDTNAQNCAGVAWDGQYLHYLRGDTGTVYVIDLNGAGANVGQIMRTYAAPFGTGTNSIQYDGSGYMYFGGGYYNTSGSTFTLSLAQVNHVAKVVVGTGGPNTEGTIVGVWKIPDFNNIAAYQTKMTYLGWDGKQILLNRRNNNEVFRYDLTNDPTIIIISPTPARIPINGVSASVIVRVLDETGTPIAGAKVTLAIENNPFYGTVSGGIQTTNTNGEATFTYTSGAVAGTDFLKATVTY